MKRSEVMDKLEVMDKKLDGLDHIIRGNGTPGLVTKMELHAVRLKALEGSRHRWRDAFFTIAGGIAVGIVVFLFSQSWSDGHVKQQPQNMSQMQQKP